MADQHQKVALVTGAGSGIGCASALALMKAGYAVVLTGRRKDKLEDTAKAGAASGGKSLVVAADITDPKAIDVVFAKLIDSFGRLDLVFNNAGIGAPRMPFEDVSVAQWKAVVDTNLTAAFLCTQHAFRIMKDQSPRGGRIINNGSISAHSPRPFSAPYTATKHAITGLTKATSLDGRAYDIACGQIDIGNAATDMTERMSSGVLQPRGDLVAEPRMDVKHVAEAVVHMAALPLDTNVQFMTIMATKMPFIGRA
jgi:NAD(P)-dependent dehydrogenase (short-subunit alcohol dehydrogenase family)